MALDEQFLLHERLKDHILFQGFAGNADAMGRWGNAPLLCYACGGAAMLVVMRRALRTSSARWYMQTAIVGGMSAIMANVFWPDSPLKPWEEGLEVLSEALFVAALLSEF